MSGRKCTVLVASLAMILSGAAIVAPTADAKAKAKPPARVTKARVTSVSRSAARITWVNPRSKNFTATVVRIATGAKAPASVKAGRAVATVRKKNHAVTVSRLAAGTSYTVGLFTTDGKKHFSKVVAVRVRTAAASKPTPPHAPTPPDRTPPAAVKNVKVTIANGIAHVSWTPPTDADFYGVRIYRTGVASRVGNTTAAAAARPELVATVGKGRNTFDDTSIQAGKTYTYDVRSRDAAGNTTPAPPAQRPTRTTVAATAPVTSPAADSSFSQDVVGIKVTWKNPSAPGTYAGVRIVRKAGSVAPSSPADGTSVATVGSSAASSFADTNVGQGATYTYGLFAYDSDGIVATGTAPAATATTSYASTAPVTKPSAVGASPTSVKLTWTVPTGIGYAGVTVVRKQGSAPTSAADGTVVGDFAKPTASKIDVGLSPSTNYSYAFYAYNGAKLPGTSPAPTATVTTPAAPVSVKPPAITGTVTAADNHAAVSGVKVSVITDNGMLTVTTKTDGTYALTGLTAGQLYRITFDPATATGLPTGGLQEITRYGKADAASVTTGVDAELPAGSAIAGKVSGAGTPLRNVVVQIFEREDYGTDVFFDAVATARTDSSGNYLVNGLDASTYEVCFDARGATDGSPNGYASECAQDQPWSDLNQPAVGSTLLNTVAGTATTVDASLSSGVALSGTVTAASGGAPVAGVDVYVYDPSSGYDPESDSHGVTTAADGTYTVRGLVPGVGYAVCFGTEHASTSGNGFAPQCYKNASWSGRNAPIDPTPVTASVASGITTGVNAVLATGSVISGIVYGGDTTTPLAGVEVKVSNGDDSGYSLLDLTTGKDGSYVARGLPAGTYQLCFSPTATTGGFAGGYHGDCLENIVVASAATATNQTITLAKAAGLKGTVTATTGGGKLAGVAVEAVDKYDNAQEGTTTGAGGAYSFSGLDSSITSVCFEPDDSVTGGSSTSGYLKKCLPVSLTDGGVTTQNATIDSGGWVTGKITGQAGVGVAGARVVAVNKSTRDVEETTSNANGTYTVIGLVTGSYFVCADGRQADGQPKGGYIPVCSVNSSWNGSEYTLPSGAGAGAVKAGAATAVNIALVVGGSFSGTVTAQTGGAALDGEVDVFDSTGVYIRYADVEDDGTYRMIGLPAGTYYACFEADDVAYAKECFKDTPWNAENGADGYVMPAGATAITVTTGADRPSVNGTLPAAAVVSGSVTSSGAAVAADVWVYDAAGHAVGHGSTGSDDSSYRIAGLVAGTYRVCVLASDRDAYAPQCWRDVTWSGYSGDLPAGATSLTLGAGDTSGSIDFALVEYGTVSGTVVSAKSGSPVQGVYVWVFDSTKHFVDSGPSRDSAHTGADGSYELRLPAGTYYLCFDANGSYTDDGDELGEASQCLSGQPWDGRVSTLPAEAATITVASGVDSSVPQVGLTSAGAVSGTVTSGTQPLQGVEVVVFDADKGSVASALSGADGSWTVAGLSPGSDFVCYEGGGAGPGSYGYLDTCRGGKAWGGRSGIGYLPVPDGAAPVAVSAAVTTTNVDDSLTTAGAVVGTVTAGGSPLVGALVTIFTLSGNDVASGYSDGDGAYLARGLATGSYYVCFDGQGAAGTGALPQCNVNKAWTRQYDESGKVSLPAGITSVSVTADKPSTVDQTLARGGAISGTVTDANGDPADLVNVDVFSAGGRLVASTKVNDTGGEYSVTGLPGGSYVVCFADETGERESQCYSGVPWYGDQGNVPIGTKPVAVTLGSTTSRVDAKLSSP